MSIIQSLSLHNFIDLNFKILHKVFKLSCLLPLINIIYGMVYLTTYSIYENLYSRMISIKLFLGICSK
jgi:hypothetical protein